MDMNIFTLNFPDEREDRFRDNYFKESISTTRISFFLLAALYSIFGYLDRSIAGDLYQDFFIIRYFIVVPLLLLVFGLSFTKSFNKYWQVLMFFTYLISALGVVIMIVQLPKDSFYSNGMMLIFLAGSIFIKLRFLWSSIAGFLTILAYIILSVYVFNNDIDLVIINVFFFVGAYLIGVFASYYIELSIRRKFDLFLQLDQKNMEIEQINSSLEIQVNKRTNSLNKKNTELQDEVARRVVIEEELLKAKERAEQADKMKSTFLANMSHEIRTPMNGIIGFANLLSEAEDEKERQEFIDTIVDSGDHLLKLINEIMDLSKIEAGMINIDLESFSLNEFTKEIHSMFLINPDIVNKEIKLSCINGSNDSDSFIKTDRMRLKQIYVNIVNNACKYTESGSIEFGYTIMESQLEFYVKDTGIGISEDQQKIIFDRYAQVSLTTKFINNKVGLGLAITKTYLKMMGGSITVNSELGKGSKFIVRIPIENNNTSKL